MEFLWIVIGAIVSIVIAQIWREYGAERFVRRRLRRSKARLHGVQMMGTISHLHIGDLAITDWVMLDGCLPSGINVKTQIDKTDVQLPTDLRALRKEIETELEVRKRQNIPVPYNGKRFALKSIRFHRSNDPAETNTCHLNLKHSDYYNFLATSGSLSRLVPGTGSSVRDLYYSNVTPDKIEHDYLFHSLGINLAVVTSDDKLVVTRRSDDLTMLPGVLNSSVDEAISRQLDLAEDRSLDLYYTAYRGLQEELGIKRDDVEELLLTSVGYSMKWCQHGVLGHSVLKINSSEVSRRLPLAKDGAFEIAKKTRSDAVPNEQEGLCVFFLENSPKGLAEFLAGRTERITSWALCTFITALISFGYSLSSISREFKGLRWQHIGEWQQ